MLLSESYDSADMFRTFHRKPHHGEFSQQSVSGWHMGSLLVLTLSLASRRRQIRNYLIPRPLFARFSHKTRCGDNPPATEAQRTLNCKNDFFLDRRRQQPRRRRRRDDQQTDGRSGSACPHRPLPAARAAVLLRSAALRSPIARFPAPPLPASAVVARPAGRSESDGRRAEVGAGRRRSHGRGGGCVRRSVCE